MKRIFILGAPDPEMVCIETMLREHGENFIYALAMDGKRVHPGNAYNMALPDRTDVDEVVLVECGFADGQPCDWLADVKLTVVDHHRPGDPGYGRPSAEFLSASSLGQVLNLLGLIEPDRGFSGSDPELEAGFRRELVCPDCGRDHGEHFQSCVIIRWDKWRMIAAADHCLGEAYKGRCPGVDPDTLMEWRVETRATFQKRFVEDVLADVERARETLLTTDRHICQCQQCGWIGQPYLGCPNCGEPGLLAGWVADLRDHEHIPELPETAVREGIPFISSIQDRDGKKKIVLQAAEAWLVKLFLRGLLVPGLTNLYGDPERGFAGGYLPAKESGGHDESK